MKKYPSIYITEQLEPDDMGMPRKVFDVSVKLSADSIPFHYNKSTEEEAIDFCKTRFGENNYTIKRSY